MCFLLSGYNGILIGQCTKAVTIEFTSHNFNNNCDFESNGLDPHFRMYDEDGTLLLFNEVANFGDVTGPEDNVVFDRASISDLCGQGYTYTFPLAAGETTRTFRVELFEKNSPGLIGECEDFTNIFGIGDDQFEMGDYTFNCNQFSGTIDPDPTECHSLNYNLSVVTIGSEEVRFEDTYCHGFEKNINGVLFNEDNPEDEITVIDPGGCDTTYFIDMEFYDETVPIISGPSDLCPNQTAMLTLDDTYLGYTWSTGSTGAATSVDAPGNYMVTVLDQNICTAVASFDIGSQGLDDPIFVPEVPEFCTGTNIEIALDDIYVSYEWSNGSTNPTITVSEVDEYSVTVTDVNGCSATSSVTVQEVSKGLDINGTGIICPNSNTVLSIEDGYTDILWSTQEETQMIIVDQEGTYSVTAIDEDGCIIVGEIVVEERVLDPVNIVGDTEVCEGADIMLSIQGSYASILWSNSDTESVIVVNEISDYSVTVTDENGCSSVGEIQLTELILPSPDILGDSLICENTTGELFVDPNYTNIEWNTGATTNVIEIDRTDTYIVTVTDENGCTSISELRAEEISPMPPEILGEEMFCSGTNATIYVEDIYESVVWSTGETSSAITVDDPGTYTVTVTLFDNCGNENELGVTEGDIITVDTTLYTCDPIMIETETISFVTAQGCMVDSLVTTELFEDETCNATVSFDVISPSCQTTSDGILNFSIDQGFLPIEFDVIDDQTMVIDEGTILNIGDQVSVSNLPTGVYQIRLTDSFGAMHIQNFTVPSPGEIHLTFTPSQTITSGQTIPLEVDYIESEIESFTWSQNGEILCEKCESFEVSPTATTEYTLLVEDVNNCPYEFIIVLMIMEENGVYIPEVMDPKEDGGNGGLWEIEGEGLRSVTEFSIFDRWGQQLYQSQPGQTTWDGTAYGAQLPAGVYIVKLNLVFEDAEEIIYGNITLIR